MKNTSYLTAQITILETKCCRTLQS